ncbi:MAG: hypothetical protein ABW128_13840 [Rhizorhabdus sp.]
MTMIYSISVALDRTMAALVSTPDIEFGRGADAALAHRYFDAEQSDCHWQARVLERWIGAYESTDLHGLKLDWMRIRGTLNSVWFITVMIVDGDGNAHDMTGKRALGRGMMHAGRPRMRDRHGRSGRDAVPDRHRVPALFARRGAVWEGGQGKQDKGTVSRQASSHCLHIVFSRDTGWATGDTRTANGQIQPFLPENRETLVPDPALSS